MRFLPCSFWVCSFAAVATVSVGCGDDDRGVPTDAGANDASAADGGAAIDGGGDAGLADAGPMCTESLIVPVDGRPCSMELRDCTTACSDPDCVTDCVDRLATFACNNCINRALVSCINRNGCQALWNCQAECLQRYCPGDPSDACVAANCMAEDDAYYVCLDIAYPTCGGRYVDCLPE